MYTTYVKPSRVNAFIREYGEPDHTSQHGGEVALQYDEIPEDAIEHYGGGWYKWEGRSKGAEEAFKMLGRHF